MTCVYVTLVNTHDLSVRHTRQCPRPVCTSHSSIPMTYVYIRLVNTRDLCIRHTRQYHDLYAAPAWRGYLSAGEMASLQQLFAKAKR